MCCISTAHSQSYDALVCSLLHIYLPPYLHQKSHMRNHCVIKVLRCQTWSATLLTLFFFEFFSSCFRIFCTGPPMCNQTIELLTEARMPALVILISH